MGYHDDVMRYIEAIAGRSNLECSTVCQRLAGQGNIYKRLKSGEGSVTMVVAEKFRAAAQSRKKLTSYLAEQHADKIGN